MSEIIYVTEEQFNKIEAQEIIDLNNQEYKIIQGIIIQKAQKMTKEEIEAKVGLSLTPTS